MPRVPDEPVLRFGRFLSEGMPTAEIVYSGERDGFEILVSRRPVGGGWVWRAVTCRDDAYAIVDAADHVQLTVRWNLGDTAGIDVVLPRVLGSEQLEPAEDDPTSGWASPLYGARHRIDARVIRVPAGTTATARFNPRGQSPLSNTDLRRGLAGILPAWALTGFTGHGRGTTTRVGSWETDDAPEET